MKVRDNYTLYVNNLLGVAFFGGSSFNNRMLNATLGEIYQCDFSQLKYNIGVLQAKGFLVIKSKS